MRLLVDTNVILDVLLDRAPHVEHSARVLAAAEAGQLNGFIGATTVTTLYYLVDKQAGRETAVAAVAKLLSILDVAPITRAVLEDALELGFRDYEDAVLAAAAASVGAEGIVTRDIRGFADSDLPVLTPAEVAAILGARGQEV
jgi:predicted nucleic acid-binding protein